MSEKATSEKAALVPEQRLTRLQAEGLFGYLSQDIHLADEGVTILHGANGSGKTTLLRCLSDVSDGKWNTLIDRPIKKLVLDFSSGNRFEYSRDENSNATYTYRKNKKKFSWSINIETLAHFMRVTEEHGLYFPIEMGFSKRMRAEMGSGDIFTKMQPDLWKSYFKRMLPDKLMADYEPPPDWLTQFNNELRCTLIEEQRLIRFAQDEEKKSKPTRVVSGFSDSVADKIRDVSRQYGEKSQQLDRTFPQRLVDSLERKPPDAHTLQEKFNQLESHRTRLEGAGLIGAEASMMQLDPISLERVEVRRLLSLYADDVTVKLSLFDVLYSKITLFEELMKEYFSRKIAKVTRKGISITSSVTNKPLDPASLSSGEQHIFVLFFQLIFNEPTVRHMVLIDEPELSLHPRWQLRFVDDLERIREVSPLDFILASHSPQIFQGHIDLGRDLNI